MVTPRPIAEQFGTGRWSLRFAEVVGDLGTPRKRHSGRLGDVLDERVEPCQSPGLADHLRVHREDEHAPLGVLDQYELVIDDLNRGRERQAGTATTDRVPSSVESDA